MRNAIRALYIIYIVVGVSVAAGRCEQLIVDDEQERDWIASCARNDGDDGREVGQ